MRGPFSTPNAAGPNLIRGSGATSPARYFWTLYSARFALSEAGIAKAWLQLAGATVMWCRAQPLVAHFAGKAWLISQARTALSVSLGIGLN
jgi:hypothetical protein